MAQGRDNALSPNQSTIGVVDMTSQSLTQERLKELLRYDPETGIFTWIKKSSKKVIIGKVAGCIGKSGYLRTRMDRTLYQNHRLAFLYMTGSFPKNQVDHINHIRTDNRWGNLRDVTYKENKRNATLQSNNTSGQVGVCWRNDAKKWTSRIKVDQVNIYLGSFENYNDAVISRKMAEQKHGFHENHGA